VFVHPRGRLVGRPIKEFYRAWKSACKAAGVPRSVATKITGHRSESVYRRCPIVSDADLQDAAAKLAASAAGTLTGTIAASGRKPLR